MKINGANMLRRASGQKLFSSVSVGKRAKGKQEPAASLKISSKGSELARKLRDDSTHKKSSGSTLEAKRERVDALISLTNRGVELSDEDKEFLTKELQTVTTANYVEKRNHLVTQEDIETAMECLKENYEKRLRVYTDMQKELDASRGEAQQVSDAKMLAAARLEEEQEKRIIEILEESLETEEEDETDEADKTDETQEKENFTIPGTSADSDDEEEEEKHMNPLVAQAIKIIEQNSEAISKMNEDASRELGEAEEYNRMMDREFLRMSDIIQDKDIKEEEKLYEYKKYQDFMQEFSFNKMIAQIKGQFDMETYLVSKIEFASHDDLEDLLSKSQNQYQNKVKQLQMILDYLA